MTIDDVHVLELESIEDCDDGHTISDNCEDDNQQDDNDAFERYGNEFVKSLHEIYLLFT